MGLAHSENYCMHEHLSWAGVLVVWNLLTKTGKLRLIILALGN